MNSQPKPNFVFKSIFEASPRSIAIVALVLLCGPFLICRAQTTSPCCQITAIDQRTGIATAKVNATAQAFEFKVANPALLQSLRVGEAIYANFTSHQVSIDGKTPSGIIVSVGATPNNSPATAPAPHPATPLGSGSTAQPRAMMPTGGTTAPCCGITSIDAAKNLASAKENTTGRTFQFKANSPAAMGSLKVGESVYANFPKMQVSLDGRNAFGTIVSIGTTIPAGINSIGKNFKLQPPPQAVLGPPQMVKGTKGPLSNKSVQGPLPYNRFTNTGTYTLAHLHGLGGIRGATGVPQGVKDLLFLQALTLPKGQVDNYVVNVQLAEKYFQAHPEPDYLKQAAAQAEGNSGCPDNRCSAIAWDCVVALAQYGGCEASRYTQQALQAAQNLWNQITGQLSQDWGQVQGCFTEQTLNPLNGQVKFSYSPQFPISFQKTGSTTDPFGPSGKFSGGISGNATFGVPMDANFAAQLQMFYLPCLEVDGVPIYVRPKSISADGTLNLSETLNASLKATGQFNQSVTIPAGGGVKFPIEVYPITIDGVPVAELDVSIYLEGDVNVNGNGSLDGSVNLQAHESTNFDFACDGGGCSGSARPVPKPDTATESVQVQGRIQLKPSVYAALQLDLDVDLLSGRAGPEPYLFGEIYGCGAASASQSTSGSSTTQQYYALTADVDWGLDLRAEALAGGQQVGQQKWRLTGGHLLFKPLAPSNALIPAIAGTTQPPLGRPALYDVKMPTCYPYTDQMEYHVQWTGNAAASTSPGLPAGAFDTVALNLKGLASGSCPSLGSGQGDCFSDPLQNLPLNLTWPVAGNYNVTIAPVRDKHGRVFDSADVSVLNVSVP